MLKIRKWHVCFFKFYRIQWVYLYLEEYGFVVEITHYDVRNGYCLGAK